MCILIGAISGYVFVMIDLLGTCYCHHGGVDASDHGVSAFGGEVVQVVHLVSLGSHYDHDQPM